MLDNKLNLKKKNYEVHDLEIFLKSSSQSTILERLGVISTKTKILVSELSNSIELVGKYNY